MAEPTSAMVRRPCRSGIFLTLGRTLAMFRGPATRRPSGRLTRQSKAASASGGKSSWPSPNPTAGSLSWEAEARRPSSSTASAVTERVWPLRRMLSAPAAKFHSRIVLSSEPEAGRPSAIPTSAVTRLVWPSMRPLSVPLAKSHSRIVLPSRRRVELLRSHVRLSDNPGWRRAPLLPIPRERSHRALVAVSPRALQE